MYFLLYLTTIYIYIFVHIYYTQINSTCNHPLNWCQVDVLSIVFKNFKARVIDDTSAFSAGGWRLEEFGDHWSWSSNNVDVGLMGKSWKIIGKPWEIPRDMEVYPLVN